MSNFKMENLELIVKKLNKKGFVVDDVGCFLDYCIGQGLSVIVDSFNVFKKITKDNPTKILWSEQIYKIYNNHKINSFIEKEIKKIDKIDDFKPKQIVKETNNSKNIEEDEEKTI